MSQYYKDADDLYKIYGYFLDRVLKDDKIGAKMSKAGIIIKFMYTDPDAEITIDLKNPPAKPGYAIGSAGPTTSGRMDAYSPLLLSKGLKAMIGKGPRSAEVKQAMKQHGAVYLAAIGGAGALISKSITKSEVVAYPELGAEAIRRMEVKDLPLIVAIDMFGNDIYQTGKEAYRKSA